MDKLKKSLKMLLLCIAMVVLSACELKAEYDMTINNNKSLDYAMIVTMDDEMVNALYSLDGNEGEMTDEQKWEVIEKAFADSDDSPEKYGFKKAKYEEDGFKGYKYTKKINSIDDVTGDKIDFGTDDSVDIENLTLFIKDGNTYKAKWKLEELDASEGQEIDVSAKFVITLPTKPVSNNADEVSKDGKTLTWNLQGAGDKTIEFAFKFSKLGIYIITVVGIALVGGAIYFVINKRKGPKPTENVKTMFDNMHGKTIDNIARPVEKEEVLDTIIEKNPTGILNPGEAVNNNDFETLSLKDSNEEMTSPVNNDPLMNPNLNMRMNNDPLMNPNINQQMNMSQNMMQNNESDSFSNNRFFAQPELKPKKVPEPTVTVESMFPTERENNTNQVNNFITPESNNNENNQNDNNSQNKFFG